MRLLLVLVLTGCTSAYVGQNCPANVNDVSTSGSGTSCSASATFKGTVKAGGACTSSSDCEPICCGCANGKGIAMAVPSCSRGTCGTMDETCCGFDKWSDICRRGPSSKFFKSCDKDSDCDSGLTCIKRFQVTSSSRVTGAVCEEPYQQKICTKSCSSDSQCTAFEGACTGSSSCNGPKNLCHDK